MQAYLADWIKAKVYSSFRVDSIEHLHYERINSAKRGAPHNTVRNTEDKLNWHKFGPLDRRKLYSFGLDQQTRQTDVICLYRFSVSNCSFTPAV